MKPTIKRLCSLILCLCLCIPLLPLAGQPVSAEAATPPVASVDLSGYADGASYTHTDGNTYTVLKSADTIVAKVKAGMSGGKFILGADIDFGGKSFTSQIFGGSTFTGVLDGNGYAFVNFSSAMSSAGNAGALFHTIDSAGTVRNLTVGAADAPISFTLTGSTPQNVGILAAKCSNSGATFENITVYSNIVFGSARGDDASIGGFVGKTKGASFTNCSFYGSIDASGASAESGTLHVGGIVGRVDNIGNQSFVNCQNSASITSSKDHALTVSAGGILGTFGVSTGEMELLFKNCVNTGAIIGDEFAGGIMGAGLSKSGPSDTSYTVTVDGCRNSGTVSAVATTAASESETAAGGIIGKAYCGYYKVTNCFSNAAVSAMKKSAAGIFGYLYVNSTAENLSEMKNCYAIGSLSFGESGAGYGMAYVSSNSSSKGYRLKVTDSYFCFDGMASAEAVYNKMVAEGSANYGAVSTEDIASGKLAYLLGQAYGQKLGTDAAPVLASADLVAFDGEQYVNVDADHFLGNDSNLYAQATYAWDKVRIILVKSADESLPEGNMTVTFWKDNTKSEQIKSFTLPGSMFTAHPAVDAAGELYYAAYNAELYGVVIKNIPGGVLGEGNCVEVSYGAFSGMIEF